MTQNHNRSSLAELTRLLAALVLVSAVVGTLVALFLWLLDVATETHWQHSWLLWLLPVAGLGIAWVYASFGKRADKGNNLILDEIHQPEVGVPGIMAPLVLGGTVLTHLFGGSAGREGTAVQIGGSISSWLGLWLKLSAPSQRTLLIAGIAAGFGAVFGTPVAGAVFAIEVLRIGKLELRPLWACLLASFIGDWVCSAWGIVHTAYNIVTPEELTWTSFLNPSLLLKAAVAGVAFGVASMLFSEGVLVFKAFLAKTVKKPLLRPLAGGLMLILMVFLLQDRSYLGLGVVHPEPGAVSIVSSFEEGGAHTWSWLWKLIFTVVTIGSGYKGGEVTPLFYIGAAMGNMLSQLLHSPADLLAALGFIAVFAGATNTPLACTIMGMELFGPEHSAFYAVACYTAYLVSGHTGIYSSQRLGRGKLLYRKSHPEHTLAQARQQRIRRLLRHMVRWRQWRRPKP